jgi:hypothetical protein
MNKDEFEQKHYEQSVCAGMNQRYHQRRCKLWTKTDRGFRIAVGFLAVLGAVMAVVSLLHPGTGWDVFGIAVAGLAAVVAVILNVFPYGEWASDHRELFRRWTDLREDVDALGFELSEEPSADLIGRLRVMESKIHRICATEPGCKEKLLNACYVAEERSRHPREPASACQ